MVISGQIVPCVDRVNRTMEVDLAPEYVSVVFLRTAEVKLLEVLTMDEDSYAYLRTHFGPLG